MPIEIERKFLVTSDCWRARSRSPGQLLVQGYLIGDGRGAGGATVRVRCAGARGVLTIKGPGAPLRAEFEYDIPLVEAEIMLATLCRHPLVRKTRYEVEHGGLLWHLDEFHEQLAGLIVAEIELMALDQLIDIPHWVGREVTGDPGFRNSALGAASDPQGVNGGGLLRWGPDGIARKLLDLGVYP